MRLKGAQTLDAKYRDFEFWLVSERKMSMSNVLIHEASRFSEAERHDPSHFVFGPFT